MYVFSGYDVEQLFDDGVHVLHGADLPLPQLAQLGGVEEFSFGATSLPPTRASSRVSNML